MKKILSIALSLLMAVSVLPMAVITAEADSVLTGDYVVIVNTNPDPTVTESTGAINFDSSNAGAENKEAPAEGFAYGADIYPAVSGDAAAVSKTYKPGDVITVRGTAYTCVLVADKCVIWMENGLKSDYDTAGKTSAAADEMRRVYEGKPYEVLNTLADGKIPYLDNSGKFSILLENDPNSTASGYYASSDFITAVNINCPAASNYMAGSFEGMAGLLAHEGQHALFHILSSAKFYPDGYLWLNEGLSITAMEWTWGMMDTSQWLSYIEGSSAVRKGSSLIYDSYRRNTSQDYSMPALYVRYLADRYSGQYAPLSFLQQVYKTSVYTNPANADTAKSAEKFMNDLFINAGMKNPDGTNLTFRQSLEDFYIAAVKQDAGGIYSFNGDTTVRNSLPAYPVYMGASGSPVQLSGTAAIVVKTVNGTFTVPSSHGSDIRYIAVNKTADPYKPATGEGTATAPFIITTAAEFITGINSYPSAYFTLADDIDISSAVYASADNFTGVLDGSGHTVSGVSRAIIYMNSGIIRNLKLVLSGGDEYSGYAAALVCDNNGIIEDCSVSGAFSPVVKGSSIRTKPVWGTLAAINEPSGTIRRCYSDAEITLTIDGNFSHDSTAGNLVGVNSGKIEDCFSAGSISAVRAGSAEGTHYLGGIAGVAKGGMSKPFYRSYSVTDVVNVSSGAATDVNVGRFCGKFVGYVYLENNFALSGIPAVGSGSGVTEKSSSELKNAAIYTGWNFSGVWKMPAGSYPVFITSSDITSLETVGTADLILGQRLDDSALYYVRLKINGNDSALTAVTGDMVDYTTFDGSIAGTQTVSCAYRGKAFTLTAVVREPESVTDLTVSVPGKTQYVIGDNYSAEGVVLTAKVNGASYPTVLYSGFTHDKNAPLSASDTAVVFTYMGESVSQAITVGALAVSSIEVVSVPDKSVYAAGETISFANLGVKLTYNDGTVTPTMELQDVLNAGVKLCERKQNGTWNEFSPDAVLTVDDNAADIFLYCSDTLPSDSSLGSAAQIEELTVQERMSIDAQTVVLKYGKEYDYAETESVKGSGYISVTKVSGSLPGGVSVYLPYEAGEGNYFTFYSDAAGVTSPIGDYPVRYKIQNETTGQILYVDITISVREKSSVAGFQFIGFYKSQNSGKIAEDIAGVIDSEAGTVTFTVPYGTPHALTLSYVTLEGGMVYTMSGDTFFMGTKDFDKVNPLLCKVVAEDGTEKAYTCTFIEAPKPVGNLILSLTPAVTSLTNQDVSVNVALNPEADISLVTVTGGSHSGDALTVNNNSCSFAADSNGTYTITAQSGGTSQSKSIIIGNIDKTAPVISGIAPGGVYCLSAEFSVNDNNSVSVTDNGNVITPANGKYTLGAGSHEIKAYDAAGNTVSVTLTVNSAHTVGTPADCCNKAVCSVCSASFGEKDMNNHIAITRIENAVASTCTVRGYSGDVVCDSCNNVISSGTELDLAPHTLTLVNAKAAICCEDGYTGDTKCSVCGTVTENGTVISKTNIHTYGEWTVISPATCTAEGEKKAVCTTPGCTEYKTEKIEKLAHTLTVVNAKAATCCEDGYTGDTKCSVCGTVTESGTVIPKTNIHTYGEWTVISPATCTAEGEKKAVCTTPGCTEYKTEKIGKLAHTLTLVNAKAATCCEDGYTGDTKCSVCGTVTENGTVIPKTNIHTYGEWTVISPATCTAEGERKAVCTTPGCGDTKTEAIASTGHSGGTATCVNKAVCAVCAEEYGEINPANHVHTHLENAYPAEIGSQGYTGDTVCDDCGVTVSYGKVIPALSEEYKCSCCAEHHHPNNFIGKIQCFFCKLQQFFRNLFK